MLFFVLSSALRRSRRRVRSVITTELPFLISKEFANNQDCDPYIMKMFAGLPTSQIADLHGARWTALFNHMDEALSKEEKQLVSAKRHNIFLILLLFTLYFWVSKFYNI